MSSYRMLPHYTYQDYLQWEGNWELIDGIPHAMSPAPNYVHQQVAALLTSLFVVQLKGCNKCRALLPVDYKIKEDTILQPDMLVVCGEVKKQFLDFPPALVVEILSPSTASKDRLYKFNIYQQQGIPYYLIIDIDKKEVEIYELNDGSFELAHKGKDFGYEFSFDDCKANIDFTEIWV